MWYSSIQVLVFNWELLKSPGILIGGIQLGVIVMSWYLNRWYSIVWYLNVGILMGVILYTQYSKDYILIRLHPSRRSALSV